jgi:hypothetical protein
MIRNLIVSSTTAGVFGISCATLGAAAFGTAALPFIVGTTIGFVFGAYSHYRQCVIESATVLMEMPDLFHYNIKHVCLQTLSMTIGLRRVWRLERFSTQMIR